MKKFSNDGMACSEEVWDSPAPVRQVLRKARRFAYTGHHFPFAFYSSSDTVFWPGCGLAGVYPTIVKKTVDILKQRLATPVGVALDCCYDPVYQLGDEATVTMAAGRIQDRLTSHNISRVITGCLNCQKILSRFLPGVTVEHVFEVLTQDALRIESAENIYLHHPCQVVQFGGIAQRARDLLHPRGKTITECQEPMCCGYGAGLSALSPAIAGKFTEQIIEAAGENHIVTYCTGCQDRFASQGRNSTHILELLSGIEPGRRPSSKSRRWFNRLLLSLSQRI